MTRSDLIAKLAERYPQLLAKDAELAVKVILDTMAATLARGGRIEIRGFRQLRAELPSATHRTQSEIGRQSAGAGQVCAAFQGRQGIA